MRKNFSLRVSKELENKIDFLKYYFNEKTKHKVIENAIDVAYLEVLSIHEENIYKQLISSLLMINVFEKEFFIDYIDEKNFKIVDDSEKSISISADYILSHKNDALNEKQSIEIYLEGNICFCNDFITSIYDFYKNIKKDYEIFYKEMPLIQLSERDKEIRSLSFICEKEDQLTILRYFIRQISLNNAIKPIR